MNILWGYNILITQCILTIGTLKMVKKLFNVKFTMASFSLGTCVHSPIPTMRELVKMQYVTVLLLSLVTGSWM